MTLYKYIITIKQSLYNMRVLPLFLKIFSINIKKNISYAKTNYHYIYILVYFFCSKKEIDKSCIINFIYLQDDWERSSIVK